MAKKKTKRKTVKKAKRAKRKVVKKARKVPRKKRDLTRYPGLEGRLFSKVKQEFHDIDYSHKLSAKEKDWLSRFMEEDLGARLNHSGTKLNKKKAQKKGCFDRNNARNRDLYSLARASGKLSGDDPARAIESLQEEYYDAQDIEDRLIDAIDKKKATE
jgi:hypothetical protein